MKVNFVHPDIKEFILDLDKISQAEAFRTMDLLEEKGHEIRMPYSKKILGNVYELRIKSIQNIRIFYTFRKNEIFLLHAVAKQKQKLTKKDISTAMHREKWLH